MKKIKFIISLLFAISIILICNKVDAKSYSIENMNIQATVLPNGDVNVKQEITYDFHGKYNGIYMTIPYNLNDIEASEAITNNQINEKLYNGNNIEINTISSKNTNKEIVFELSNRASNGQNGIYTKESMKEKLLNMIILLKIFV